MNQGIRLASFVRLLAILGALPLAAAAQGDLVPPRALVSPLPPQPVNSREVPVEAFITVRYSVRADGTPADVRVLEFMPPTIDPAPTVATVSGWTFTPGTRDGRPIDWHNNETVVIFRSGGGAPGDIEIFQQRLAAIDEMLAAETPDYAAAQAASDALLGEYATRLADTGLALVQAAVTRIGTGNLNAALAPLRMATDPRVPMLSGTELRPALELRMNLEGQLGRNADARKSLARLVKGLGPDNPNPQYTELGATLDNAAATEEFLPVTAVIVQDAWRIDVGRRFFFIVDVVGAIDSIVAECDTRRIELAFNPDDNYGLPDSLGACSIFVHGDPGTRFTFVEALPAED